MGDVWPQLALVVVLVALNAAFAGTEMALVSLREGQLQRLAGASAGGARLARLAADPNRYLATIQVGITLAGFLASAAAAVSLAEPLVGPLDFLGSAAEPTAIVVVTVVLAFVTLVLGELVPKRIAMQHAERWGLVMARPLQVLMAVTRPVVWLLSTTTDLVVRLLRNDPDELRSRVTEDEIRDLVAMHDTFSPEQRRIIEGAFEIAERRITQVLVPRGDVVVADADSTCGEVVQLLRTSGHSRAPLAPGADLDEVVGLVHLIDLVGRDPDEPVVAAVEAPVVPEMARASTVLRELQGRRVPMAVVIDEHGGAVGIVTVEDLVEEIVGEIHDETDRRTVTVGHEPDGTIVVPGRFPVHDLADLGVELPTGSYASIAGLVLDRLGHFPAAGEAVEIDDWSVEVRRVDGHRIAELALRPTVSSDP